MAYLARDWQNVPKMQRTCQKGIKLTLTQERIRSIY